MEKIIESLRLEKTSKLIKSNHQETPKPHNISTYLILLSIASIWSCFSLNNFFSDSTSLCFSSSSFCRR